MSEASVKMSKFIRQLFYILFFVTPLLLWPFTSEVFEFNKMMFVYLMTIIIGAVWLIKSFLDHKFEIAKTPLDIPILLFLASQIISTIISINPHTSLWGYYSRFHGGLMSTISYIVLYYALITHFTDQAKAIRHLITAILSSAAIISFYAILEHLGIDKNIWVQDVQNRVFSTLGQPNWLSAFLITLTPFALFQAINAESKNRRYVNASLSLLYLIAILFTKSQSGLGATAIVLLAFFIITAVQKHKSWLILSLIPVIALLFVFKGPTIDQTFKSLNKINPFYSNTLAIVTEENKTRVGGSDSMTIRRVVWEGAIKLGLQHPLFGTGVETFGYTYYWVRPAAHNLTSENDFLYNKAHNEYLNFLATTGFVGLATYLFLIGAILFVIARQSAFGGRNKTTKQSPSDEFKMPILLGFLSILITNYFGFSVVNIALFFFLFPAIYLSSRNQVQLKNLKLGLDSTIGIIAISAIALWTIYGTTKAWRADIAYNLGKESYTEAKKAIDLNPNEPIYYAQFGNINALVATQIIEPQIAKLPATASAELKQEAQAYLDQYTSAAVDNLNKAVTLNPYNINILKTKAKTELTLALLDPKYNQTALQTLLKISELSPTESSNFFNIGLLYLNLGNQDLAKMAFQKAVDLKPDYQQAQDYLNQLNQPAAKK
jgi:putative inorganic carbon (hco3(-)) transporter